MKQKTKTETPIYAYIIKKENFDHIMKSIANEMNKITGFLSSKDYDLTVQSINHTWHTYRDYMPPNQLGLTYVNNTIRPIEHIIDEVRCFFVFYF